jgi:sugar phosphate isomerase/epimerase
MTSLNRRRFLGAAIGTGAAAATAGSLAPAASAHRDGWGWGSGGRVPRNRIGMQLWSVRDVMKDSAQAESFLRFLARIGDTEIEPFGESYGWTAAQFRAVLDRYDLRAPSRHGHDPSMVDPANAGWKTAFQQQLEDANIMGQEYTGLAWFPGPYTTEQFTFMAERFNEAGALAKAEGLKFFYHNHDFEFTSKQADGTPNYNILLEQTDRELVSFELDLYWIVYGGESPVHYLADDPARYPLYHVKDRTWRDRGPDIQDWEDVGPGSIDFPDIFAAGDGRRLDKHYIIEHDEPQLTHGKDDEQAEHKTSLAGVKYLREVRW